MVLRAVEQFERFVEGSLHRLCSCIFALVREEYIFSSADRCTFVLDSHLQQRMNLDEVIEKETARFASSASPPSVRGHLTLCRFSSIIIPSRKVAFERRGIQSSPPSPS